eukprot:4688936-Prorocentrum_lima.AAC.1
MTSSLVGSEMCIRDRGLPCTVPDRLSRVSLAGRWTFAPHTSVHRALPVSYTHLTLPTICSV